MFSAKLHPRRALFCAQDGNRSLGLADFHGVPLSRGGDNRARTAGQSNDKGLGLMRRGVGQRLSCAFVFAVLAACSHQIPLGPASLPVPDSPKISERVGVYFSPEFKDYVHSEEHSGDTWVFPLGRASTDLFKVTFAQAFATTVPVEHLPPLEGDLAALPGVIEPRIEGFSFDIPFIKTGTYSAEITYRFTIHTPNGDPVASWTVTGAGAQHGQFGFEFARWPGEATDLAMEDVARKFLEGLRNVPEVRRWLRERGTLVSMANPLHDETRAGR